MSKPLESTNAKGSKGGKQTRTKSESERETQKAEMTTHEHAGK